MKKSVFNKWIKALMSGEYKQTKGTLSKDKKHFCCLGVLAKVEGCDFNYKLLPVLAITPKKEIANFGTTPSTYSAYLKPKLFGLSKRRQGTLAKMNDSGKSFEEIAAYLKKHKDKIVTT